MAARNQANTCAVIVLAIFSCCSFALADEITFKNKSAKQTGTVVEENEQQVTVIFPRESIKSITQSKEGRVKPSADKIILEDNGAYITVKIPRQRLEGSSPLIQFGDESAKQQEASLSDPQLREKVARIEKKMESMEKERKLPTGSSPAVGSTHEALMKEEMGSVEGVILWKDKPLQNAKVMIVMEKYSGFSVASLKKTFGVANDKSSGSEELYLEAETDAQGRYSFQQVPPGYYTLFWRPDPQTGWIRRLREDPDIEIIPGKLTVLNIPEKKKQM